MLAYDDGVLHEVLGDDAVENQEDAEGYDEEDGDGEDEEESGPEGVGLGQADWREAAVVVFFVGEVRDRQDRAVGMKLWS